MIRMNVPPIAAATQPPQACPTPLSVGSANGSLLVELGV